MRISQGTVTKPAGKVFETKYGEKQMLIVTLPDGTEEKFYVNPNSPQSRLQRNENVSIVYEMRQGKQIRRIVIDEDAQPQNQSYNNSSPSNPPKSYNNSGSSYTTPKQPEVEPRVWAKGEAANIASLMSTVVTELQKEGFTDLTVEDVRTVAISIYISCQRKFPGGFDLTEPEEKAKPVVEVDYAEPEGEDLF